jgi:hypothetical protein
MQGTDWTWAAPRPFCGAFATIVAIGGIPTLGQLILQRRHESVARIYMYRFFQTGFSCRFTLCMLAAIRGTGNAPSERAAGFRNIENLGLAVSEGEFNG